MKFLENVYEMWSAGKEIVIAEIAEAPNVERQVEIVPQLPNLSGEIDISQVSEAKHVLDQTQSESSNSSEGEFIRKIKTPPKVLVRGRPKGATLTVIGLPKKKSLKITPFDKKSYIEKQDIILSWFLDKATISKIKKENYLAEETDIECRPEKITSAIFHEAVDINLIRCFFSLEGWTTLQPVINTKKIIVCPICCKDIGAESTIVCALCLLTHHSTCGGQKINLKNVVLLFMSTKSNIICI